MVWRGVVRRASTLKVRVVFFSGTVSDTTFPPIINLENGDNNKQRGGDSDSNIETCKCKCERERICMPDVLAMEMIQRWKNV